VVHLLEDLKLDQIPYMSLPKGGDFA
jgi:hypothetical protein